MEPKIVVEKLTRNVNEAHLREIFSVYGPIKDLDVPLNRQCTLDIFNQPSLFP